MGPKVSIVCMSVEPPSCSTSDLFGNKIKDAVEADQRNDSRHQPDADGGGSEASKEEDIVKNGCNGGKGKPFHQVPGYLPAC